MNPVSDWKAFALACGLGGLVVGLAGVALGLVGQASEEGSCSLWVNCGQPDALPPMAKGLLAILIMLLLLPLSGHYGAMIRQAFAKQDKDGA